MDWIQRRAGLIGIGAIVVAAVAVGVAVADGGHDHRRMIRVMGPMFANRFAPGPYGGGPLRRFEAAPHQVQPPPGPMGRPFGGRPGLGGTAGGVMHGEVTVPGPSGRFQTYDIQRGTVAEVSANALTVRSDDGFTKTYAATASTVKGVSKGDDVQVRATVSGGKATIATLVDLSHMTLSRAPMSFGY